MSKGYERCTFLPANRPAEALHFSTGVYIHEVLKVLDVERETWRLLCEQMPEAPDPRLVEAMQPKEISAKGMGSVAPLPSFTEGQMLRSDTPAQSGMSWEA